MSRETIHFVTGRLAENALRATLESLAQEAGFRYSVDVLPITVAALMTPRWIARHLRVPESSDRVILPGYCHGDLEVVHEVAGVPVERGPRDLRQLPDYFGKSGQPPSGYGDYDIEILAEINHAPRLEREVILREAQQLASDGADMIDVGCDPGSVWLGVEDCVKALRDQGRRVSIDTFHPREMELAVRAGAELILSVNSTNRDAAANLGCEVVAIPDEANGLEGLDATVEFLERRGVELRIDPLLAPIGCGFAACLGRYLEVRRRWPAAEMLMGVGNLSELTDADSAGVNVILLGICQELEVRSVLTTQVINWARSSVRECDLARRLVHYAVRRQVPPKHVEPRLVMLRDVKRPEFGVDQLTHLAQSIRDNNVRVFAEAGSLHMISGGMHLQGDNPFGLFEQLLETCRDKQTAGAPHPHLDASHAFYLGYEMAKAVTALTLGKEYRQDELNWGLLTVAEQSHRNRRPPDNDFN